MSRNRITAHSPHATHAKPRQPETVFKFADHYTCPAHDVYKDGSRQERTF
jgi:hypothetical protein